KIIGGTRPAHPLPPRRRLFQTRSPGSSRPKRRRRPSATLRRRDAAPWQRRRAARGLAARDVAGYAAMAVRLGEAMLRWDGAVASVDLNPVIVFETGAGAVAVDALVECRL